MSIRERMQVFKMGQRVKVKGQTQADGKFVALEIKLKEDEEFASIEGVVQGVEPLRQVLRLCNQELPVPSTAVILDDERNEISLAELNIGDTIKAKGTYGPDGKFSPDKIKVKDSGDPDESELQGFIQKIDRENGVLRVAGIHAVVTIETEIDGF